MDNICVLLCTRSCFQELQQDFIKKKFGIGFAEICKTSGCALRQLSMDVKALAKSMYHYNIKTVQG
jgi:hypothetical protein